MTLLETLPNALISITYNLHNLPITDVKWKNKDYAYWGQQERCFLTKTYSPRPKCNKKYLKYFFFHSDVDNQVI